MGVGGQRLKIGFYFLTIVSMQKINYKKWLLSGVLAHIVGFVVSSLTCGWLFNWVYFVPPTEAWKPMTAPDANWLLWMNLGGLVFSLLLALVYALLYQGIPGKKGLEKGFVFGVLIFFVSVLPGGFYYLMLMNVSSVFVIYFILQGLALSIIRGLVLGVVYKTK